MSRLDELIKELCPNGVEYKQLEEIAEYRRGSFPQPYTNKAFYGGENSMPFVQVADMLDDSFLLASETKQTISKLAQPKSVFVPSGTVVVSLQGTLGRVAITQYDSYVDRTIAIFQSYKREINKKYFAYILKQKFEFEKQYARGSTLKTITKEEFSKFLVPVPPLEIQEEIVKILDKFTDYVTELQTELQARRQQYEYYRNHLLGNDDVELTELKSVIKSKCSGATPTKGKREYYDGGVIPWIRTQDVRFNEIKEVEGRITEVALMKTAVKWIPENCVIVAISGASAGRCAINKFKATTNQHCLNLEIDSDKALFKYVFYCVSDKYAELLSKKQGARGDLNSSLILETKIPVPSLDRQAEIVELLDKFETICSDIYDGIPAEIEARQKQYEYYRDKLLAFKELEVQ